MQVRRCHKLLSRPIDFLNCQVYVFTPMYSKCLLFCAEAVVTLVGIRRPIYPTAVARQTLAICVILTPGVRIITNFSVRELPHVQQISAIYLLIIRYFSRNFFIY